MLNSAEPLAELLSALRHLLEEERSVLLSGYPERLAGVVERKLRLAETIEHECETPDAAPYREEILWLAGYNRGNSVICSAVLRQLTRTLDALRRRELHRSYCPDGAEASRSAQHPLGVA